MPATGSDHPGQPPRRTIRLRLAMTYGALFLISGAALLGFVYGLVYSALTQRSSITFVNGGGPDLGLGSQSMPVPSTLDPTTVKAQVTAMADAARSNVLHTLLTQSIIALVVMVAVSAFLGWLMAGRVLRPVREMTSRARRLSEVNLNQRLGVVGPDDELKELGDTFDGLLARLDTAFEAQKRFVANASHELRTPLTLQKALIEVALSDPNADAATLRAVCERVLRAADDQARLIEALLTLARSQRGLDRHEQFDLAPVIKDVIAERREANPVPVRVDSDLRTAPISGDRRLVERLVGNLVDNALRYNVPGGWVAVHTGVNGAGVATVRVVNSGPVIPPDRLDQLFQPFQRLASRAARPDGHGLGLSIVVAIAHAHGAHVAAQTRPMPHGGLAVTVSFPVSMWQPVPVTTPSVATVPRVAVPPSVTSERVATETPAIQ